LDSVSVAAESKAFENSLEGRLGSAALSEIDRSLSDDQRNTLKLYFHEGLTLEEIAARLHQSIGNIRNHYYRGLDRMRKSIASRRP
jgi:RNA polymerase sigma-70 factor (ECF subfamily)